MMDRLTPQPDAAEMLAELHHLEDIAARTPWEGASPLTAADLEVTLARVHRGIRERNQSSRTASRFRTVAIAACAILAVSIVLLTSRSAPLSASGINGELRVLTTQPKLGARIDVEYVAPATLARERRLHLRALFRRPWDRPYAYATVYRRVAVLERGRDGLFRGSFVLPDSTVYAALAVEDEEASRVDSRGGKRWEVLVYDEPARVAWDAYEQRINELIGRNSEAALATTRERAAAYPNDPRAWSAVLSLEQFNLRGAAEALVPSHRERVLAMHRQFSRLPRPSNALIEEMRRYVVQFDLQKDAELQQVGAFWREARSRRMTQVLTAARSDVVVTDPTAAEWIIWELNRASMSTRPDSVLSALERLEALAARLARETEMVRTVGYQLARSSPDPAAFLRWADRRSAAMPNQRDAWYGEPLRVDSLRRPVIARLTDIAEQLLRPDDARRPLELTRAAAARADSAHALRVLVQVASGLELDKDTTGALRVLDRAALIGWNHDVALRRAALRLALHDTTAALDPLAQVVADPTTTPSQADSLSRLVAHLKPARWQAATASAGRAMREYFLRDATREVLPESVMVSDSAGTPISLRTLAGGVRTVVLFWSPFCPFSRTELERVAPLVESLRREGARLIIISDTPRGPESDVLAKPTGLVGVSYYDAQGETGRAFHVWSIPNYAVLDADGALRFSNSTADRVVAQVVSLRGQK